LKKLITSINNKKLIPKSKIEKLKNGINIKSNSQTMDMFNKNQKINSMLKNTTFPFSNSNLNSNIENKKESEKEPKVVFNNPIMSILNLNKNALQKDTIANNVNVNDPVNTMNSLDFLNQFNINPYQNLNYNINPNQNMSFQNQFLPNSQLKQSGNLPTSAEDRYLLLNNLNNISNYNSMKEAIFQKNLYDYFTSRIKNNTTGPMGQTGTPGLAGQSNDPNDLQAKLAIFLKEQKINQEFMFGQYKQQLFQGANNMGLNNMTNANNAILNDKLNFSQNTNLFQDKNKPRKIRSNHIEVARYIKSAQLYSMNINNNISFNNINGNWLIILINLNNL